MRAPCPPPAERRPASLAALAAVVLAGLGTAGAEPVVAAEAAWRELEPGLELGVFPWPEGAAGPGDGAEIWTLRIDPARHELVLLNASAAPPSAPAGGRRSARAWAAGHGLAAAINASMYQEDYRTSVSLMRTREHVNNAHLSADNAVLAFDPLGPDVPPARLIDRRCDDLDALRPRYGSLVQSIRMISCHRANVWEPQDRRWSTAAIGVDGAGRILFVHCREPSSVHDLGDALLALPLDLAGAMYVEGGREAQLYVAAGGEQHERLGVGGGLLARPVPNVVGVRRRPPPVLTEAAEAPSPRSPREPVAGASGPGSPDGRPGVD